MEKIISLFKRDYEKTHLVYDEVVPGAEWVANGEGVATRKYDGTCCLIRNGKLYKRHEVKNGKTPPADFEPVTPIDEVTGKQQGWVPVGDSPEDQYHREAFREGMLDGTYELVGPKIQGNPEEYDKHTLIGHDEAECVADFPRDFNGIKSALENYPHEGIVWHHPDGRMVKIKRKDFWR